MIQITRGPSVWNNTILQLSFPFMAFMCFYMAQVECEGDPLWGLAKGFFYAIVNVPAWWFLWFLVETIGKAMNKAQGIDDNKWGH